MKHSRGLAWMMLLVWGAWLAGGQAMLATNFGTWVPDISLILLFALCAELDSRDVPVLCGVLAFARLAFTVEPVEATLCGLFTLGACALGVRSVAEASGPLVRTLWGGLGVLAYSAWMIVVHETRSEASLQLGWQIAIPTAVSSAFFALLFGPMLARLPGLTPLRRVRW